MTLARGRPESDWLGTDYSTQKYGIAEINGDALIAQQWPRPKWQSQYKTCWVRGAI
ncbi:MAG: hypothetical protein GY820_07650, partial [Gammaproteobacteria bacterium]|nr:hypothetical protein [Gammaproteobacteria bacterium]